MHKKTKSDSDLEGLRSNHVKYLKQENLGIVKMFLNSCKIHGYFPKPMVNANITQRSKIKNGDLMSSRILREIMIMSALFKLFEYCILPSFSEHGILSLWV